MKPICLFAAVMLFVDGTFVDSVKYQCNNCREYVARWWIWNVCADSSEFKINLCLNKATDFSQGNISFLKVMYPL